MIKNIIFLSIIFLMTNNSFAEIAKKIVIDGNQRISEETIKLYGDIELNKDYKESDLDKILKNLYSTDFFSDVKISLSNNILNVKLKEYPVINQLAIVGEKNKRYKDEIRKLISLKEKRSFINQI